MFKPIYKLVNWFPYDKIDWSALSMNPNATKLLERNLDKVDWSGLCKNEKWILDRYDADGCYIRECYYNNKNIHTVCHLRRGDIAEVTFTGSHSMISKETYIRQLYSLCAEFSSVVWLSESKQDRTENIWNNKSPGHRWTYPKGEHYCPDIILDFLPDLLSMIFARVLLRGNSSLSWWGAFLSEAEVYSPVIKPKPLERKNKYYILDTEFVKGNAPHFMGCKLDSDFFNDIIFFLKSKNSHTEICVCVEMKSFRIFRFADFAEKKSF